MTNNTLQIINDNNTLDITQDIDQSAIEMYIPINIRVISIRYGVK